jgi:hypothetical protein
MTETWPAYESKVLNHARIIETETGQVVWEPADHMAVVRIRTKLETIIPVPKKLVGIHADLNRLRPYVIDELHRLIDAEPRNAMTEVDQPEVEPEPETTDEPDEPEVEPAPEPDQEPSDPHTAPLDDDDDARNLDPVDPRRRAAEERRGRSFDDPED